jgi:hypothetical protein
VSVVPARAPSFTEPGQGEAFVEQLAALRRMMADIVQRRFFPEEGSTTRSHSAQSGVDPAGLGHWASMWVHLMRGAGVLASFLGPDLASSVLVPSFMWLPNEQDWRVRVAFYQHLPEVARSVVRSFHF